MNIDPATDRHMVATLRREGARGPWLRLLSQLLALAQGHAEFVRHEERPWASATFSGSRHTVALRFVGVDAIAAGEAYIAALPEHEFTVPGQLVADAQIVLVEHRQDGGPDLTVEAELLLVVES